ncbi:MAG TPA: 3-oxoacyl-ACP reductase family protein [Burkholderiales bacterium]|nr:3-oxoacyl-ACP reductase family protein [Burkholderiales bacterium]
MGRLDGKTALVTGGGRGIGQAIALRFAREGASVAIVGPRKQTLDDTVSKAPGIVPIVGDVTKQDQVDAAMAAFMKKFGRIDILVNNAGGTDPKPFFDKTGEDWKRTYELNVVSAFLCAQAAARHMLGAKKGTIVNISSVRGLEHCGREPIMDYSAAKAAMTSFTMTLAKQLAPHITVNAVGPGHTKTDIWKQLPQEVKDKMLAGTYLQRFAEPDDIANAVVFLSSDEASFITGQHLVVDGGFSLKAG